MLYVNATREDLLDCLPKGLACAEIGVAEGEFSAAILTRAAPSVLHLIDPWVHQDRPDYTTDFNNVPDAEQEQRHAKVLARFADAPAVRVHRAFSADAAAAIADGSLDFAYVDAVHSHDGVLADLLAFAPKMKPDGLLCGHDFGSHAAGRRMGFGVVGGVVEFIKQSQFEIVALTAERGATYALARRGSEGTRRAFAARLLGRQHFVIELPGELAAALSHRRVVDAQGRLLRHLPSFRMG